MRERGRRTPPMAVAQALEHPALLEVAIDRECRRLGRTLVGDTDPRVRDSARTGATAASTRAAARPRTPSHRPVSGGPARRRPRNPARAGSADRSAAPGRNFGTPAVIFSSSRWYPESGRRSPRPLPSRCRAGDRCGPFVATPRRDRGTAALRPGPGNVAVHACHRVLLSRPRRCLSPNRRSERALGHQCRIRTARPHSEWLLSKPMLDRTRHQPRRRTRSLSLAS